MKPFTKLQEPITFTTTAAYEPESPWINPGSQMITISFPPPAIRGKKHPGGRVLRKSRLCKKRAKYCQIMGYARTYNGFMSSYQMSEMEDGETQLSLKLELLGAVL